MLKELHFTFAHGKAITLAIDIKMLRQMLDVHEFQFIKQQQTDQFRCYDSIVLPRSKQLESSIQRGHLNCFFCHFTVDDEFVACIAPQYDQLFATNIFWLSNTLVIVANKYGCMADNVRAAKIQIDRSLFGIGCQRQDIQFTRLQFFFNCTPCAHFKCETNPNLSGYSLDDVD